MAKILNLNTGEEFTKRNYFGDIGDFEFSDLTMDFSDLDFKFEILPAANVFEDNYIIFDFERKIEYIEHIKISENG